MRRLGMLACLVGSVFAQNIPPSVAMPTLASSYAIDCSTVSALTSCHSYNEMVQQKDRDLLSEVEGPSFVCFRPEEDVFLVISPVSPSTDMAFVTVNKYLSRMSAMVFYNRYNEGVAEDSRIVAGDWKKFATSNDATVTFESSKEDATKVSFDTSELTLSYDYKNLGGSTTTYSIQVRRSTKRFVETYQFPEDPRETKTKVPIQKPSGNTRMQYTGYCAEFK